MGSPSSQYLLNAEVTTNSTLILSFFLKRVYNYGLPRHVKLNWSKKNVAVADFMIQNRLEVVKADEQRNHYLYVFGCWDKSIPLPYQRELFVDGSMKFSFINFYCKNTNSYLKIIEI